MEIYKAQPRRLKNKRPAGRTLLVALGGCAIVALLAFSGYFFYLLGALPKVDRLAD